MREHLEKHNVYRWGGKVLSELLKFDFPETVGPPALNSDEWPQRATIRASA
jgi:hypothetical protein